MSTIRKTHTGYYGVAMAVAVAWYLLLGLGFTFLPHRFYSSESYTLVGRLVSLRTWGPVYIALGLGLALSASVTPIPHFWVRAFAAVGLAVTSFWMMCFVASIFLNYLTAFTFVPATLTIVLCELRVLIEPEDGAARAR